ncbi:MAG TPA: hypothetical protein VJZ00_23675 [Thermoanaerobaculia bacterium]|nr:hypothetical protein [Thermoanaerobaculia bacterium]
MAKVKVSYTAPGADVVTADLDGTPISFSGTAKAGEATVTVGAGKHRVHYVIEGLPNTSYTVKIDDKSITDTIGPSGKAAGSIPFTVPGAASAKVKAAIGVAAAAAAVGVAAAARSRGKKKAAAKKASSKKKPAKASAKRSSAKRSTSSKKTSSKKRASSKKGGRR